jgi:hypothetical protein
VPPLATSSTTSPTGKGAAGFCRVRVFVGTEASGSLPIVVLTEPNENPGPSVTNTIEQLGAEVLARYLPEQDGLEPPFVLIEHYPDRQPRGIDARWHDPFFDETFDLVTFAHCSPRPRWAGLRRGMLHSFGTHDWQHTTRLHVEDLVGERLDWPACSCRASSRCQTPVQQQIQP